MVEVINDDIDLFVAFVEDVIKRFDIPYEIGTVVPVGLSLFPTDKRKSTIHVYLGGWVGSPTQIQVLFTATGEWYHSELADPEADQQLGKILIDISHR